MGLYTWKNPFTQYEMHNLYLNVPLSIDGEEESRSKTPQPDLHIHEMKGSRKLDSQKAEWKTMRKEE